MIQALISSRIFSVRSDCFTFAMEILNDRLQGDLKRNPEGDDNDERFEDLKKDRT